MTNKNQKVIDDFGKEWKTYNQNNLNKEELSVLFNNYFGIFPFEKIGKNSIGFDMGCGSGRWAKLIAPKVKTLNCIEPSKIAIGEAKQNLIKFTNCKFQNNDVTDNILPSGSQDFGYCLGVLHHIPNTSLGLKSCVEKLKKGAPFLLYLYYKFDNRPFWFQLIWKISNLIRIITSMLPFVIKLYISKIIAFLIYLPFAKASFILSNFGFNVDHLPLSSYRNASFYTMKTDSLDRFGTRLEHRFTKEEITLMMKEAGLINIKFSDKTPYWVAVGEKK